MDSDEEPLINHKIKNVLKIMKLREPKIILHKLSTRQWEKLKSNKSISLTDGIFTESEGIYDQKQFESKIYEEASLVQNFDLPKNDAIKSDPEPDDDASRKRKYSKSKILLPGGPEFHQQLEKRKKHNCPYNLGDFVQCFPVDPNQNDLKIEFVIPSTFLSKKQKRIGKIKFDLNHMPNLRNISDSVNIDYKDPETRQMVNIFCIKNDELDNVNKSTRAKLKRKPYKQLNIVKVKPRIPLRSSLDSSPTNIVSSSTSLPRHYIFDQSRCEDQNEPNETSTKQLMEHEVPFSIPNGAYNNMPEIERNAFTISSSQMSPIKEFIVENECTDEAKKEIPDQSSDYSLVGKDETKTKSILDEDGMIDLLASDDDLDFGGVEEDSFKIKTFKNEKSYVFDDHSQNSTQCSGNALNELNDKESLKNVKVTFNNSLLEQDLNNDLSDKSSKTMSVNLTDNNSLLEQDLNNDLSDKSSKTMSVNLTVFKIPRTCIVQKDNLEQKTLLNYVEDNESLTNSDKTRRNIRNIEDNSNDRNFLRIFEKPCFNFFKNGCSKSSCEYSHRSIPNQQIKVELRKLSSGDIINIFKSVCFFPGLKRIHIQPFFEVFVERREPNNLNEEWKLLNLPKDADLEINWIHKIIKDELLKIEAEDIIPFFQSICHFQKLLRVCVSPFLEILVDRQDTSSLLKLYKIVNSTQESAYDYIIPFQKAFQNSGWPITSILKRMFLNIRNLHNLQLNVLNFFFNSFVKAVNFDLSDITEIINNTHFIITVDNMNLLISEFIKSNQINNVNFGKLLLTKLISIMDDIQNAPIERKTFITKYLEDLETKCN
ncbi:hypothetical protein ACFFRR_001181 [Megaselia abdita]